MTWSGATIGDLTYDYDVVGRRVTMSGTLARLNLPAAVSTALYNANNQLTKWGNTNISYDNNGNMLGDGTNTYSWNARDQLQAVTKSGQTLPSFTYDALGRRLTKTLGSTTTTYRYDGANAVQEKNGSTVTASMLTGLGVDEVFQRTEGATVRTFMSDALGSTLALTDGSGVVKTSYTYAPYGATTASGDVSANTSQFTGRDNDADGLYYYRARYYHPVLGRFISEDPIGFQSGSVNLYEYASDQPTLLADPSGNCVPVALAMAAIDIGAFVLSGRKSQKSATDWLQFGISLALDFSCVGMFAKLGGGLRLATAAAGGLNRGPMQVVRTIGKGERLAPLINELWTHHVTSGVEHAIVVLGTGERAIVRGGPEGIDFASGQIRRLIAHTHANTLGPSKQDLDALTGLAQTRSYLIELERPGSWRMFRGR